MRLFRAIAGLGILLLLVVLSERRTPSPKGRPVSSNSSTSFRPETATKAGASATAARVASIPSPITPARVGSDRYTLRDKAVSVQFDAQGLLFAILPPGAPGWGLRWGLRGAAVRAPRPTDLLEARASYFVGMPAAWKTGLACYSGLIYENLRDGIDLRVTSRAHAVKYTLEIPPGPRVQRLPLRYEGARELRLHDDGRSLEVVTPVGSLRESGLDCWQESDGGRIAVHARFAVEGPESYAIELGEYDPAKPLVVDPEITWSSYVGGSKALGGTASDDARGVAVDASGNVVVVGSTACPDFPVSGALYPALNRYQDAFVTKISAAGTVLWSTFLGGGASDAAEAVAVDASGNVVVVGTTQSTDFPLAGAFDGFFSGNYNEGFVTKIAANGTSLMWSSFLGGSIEDNPRDVAVDPSGNVIVVGNTTSPDFPASGGFDTSYSGGIEAFVAKIQGDGSAILWSSFLGGSGDDNAAALAVDASGNVYVTGQTASTDFPAPGGVYTTKSAGADAFVVKVNAAGSSLAWGTFLGGSGDESGEGIALAAGGEVIVAGWTQSSNFPLKNAFDSTIGGPEAFVVRLASTGDSLVWSSFLGGSSIDRADDVKVDAGGAIYVVGQTLSTDFPGLGGFDATPNGSYDAFVAKIAGDGSAVAWSSVVGGSSLDYGRALAIAPSGALLVVGQTYSSDFPIVGGFDSSLGGQFDGFVVSINPSVPSITWSAYLGGAFDSATDLPGGLAVDAAGFLYVTGKTEAVDFPTVGPLDASLGGSADAFVTKIDPSVPAVVWSTYLGGSSVDDASAVAVDAAGNVFVLGETISTNFPSTPGAYRQTNQGSYDLFVAKISGSGSSLLWSTYLGGSSIDQPGSLALDSAGAPVVTGRTFGSFAGVSGAFVLRLDASGSSVTWARTLTGVANGYARAVALDATDNVLLAGQTDFSGLPTTPGLQTAPGGASDAFAMKLGPTGTPVLWCTYLGGSQNDAAYAIAVDQAGNAYVTGETSSANFPTAGGLDATLHGVQNAFLVKIPSSGSAMAWSGYLGGSYSEIGRAVAADTNGIYVVGQAASANFPTVGAIDSTLGGPSDAFVTKYDPASGAVAWSTYLGGSQGDYGIAARVAGPGMLFVAGYTFSSDFPVPGAFDATYGGGKEDVFVTRIRDGSPDYPTALAQRRLPAAPPLPAGGWTDRSDIVLEGVVVDKDGGLLLMEVEVRPVDVPFSFVATSNSLTVASGSTASVTVAPAVGEYHWQARAVDAVGHRSGWVAFGGNADAPPDSVAARDFGRDSTPPTISGTAPATTATSPVTVTGTADDPSGIASVTWINAATNATGTATGTVSWTASVPLILGPNTIVFFAWDAAGNISSWTTTVTYTPADTTPPVVTIQTPTTSPSYSATSTPLAIGGTATDNVGVTDVRWINLETGMNGAAVLVGSAWTASAPLRFGVNHLEVRTTDAAGNVGVAALRVRFTAIPDAGPPTIMITGPTASPTYSTSAAPMALSGTAGDDVGVAVVRWTNAGTGSAGICQGTTSWTASLGLEPGLNTIAVTAEDAAGNTSTASLQVTFTPGGVDDRPPVLIVLSAPLTATKTPATVSGVAADDVGVAEVVWLNATAGASAAATGTASWTAQVDLVPGANIITIRSIDTSGNETEVPLTITYSPPSGGGGGGGGGGCGLLGLEVALVVYLARRRSSSR